RTSRSTRPCGSSSSGVWAWTSRNWTRRCSCRTCADASSRGPMSTRPVLRNRDLAFDGSSRRANSPTRELAMTETMRETIQVLRIFDVDRAREFYLGFLGFTLDWEHRFEPEAPLYMQISRGALRLHLSEHHGDGCPGAVIFVRMTGLDEYHQEISAKGYRVPRPGIEKAPWHARMMLVTDPFGNRLRLNEDLPGSRPG